MWCEFPYCPLHGNGPWRAGELVRDCFCLDMCLCLTSIPHGDVACLQIQVNKDGQAVQADAALTGKVKLVLFSANNAMAKDFVFRYLAPLYGMLKSKGVFFEVVFVSEDPNEEAFKAYFAEMPRYLSDESLLVNYVTGIIVVMTHPIQKSMGMGCPTCELALRCCCCCTAGWRSPTLTQPAARGSTTPWVTLRDLA